MNARVELWSEGVHELHLHRIAVAWVFCALAGCVSSRPTTTPPPTAVARLPECPQSLSDTSVDDPGKCPSDISEDSDVLATPDVPVANNATETSDTYTPSCFAAPKAEQQLRDAVVASARAWLEHPAKTRRGDCSSLVMAIMANVGVTITGGSRDFWQTAVREGRIVQKPTPGDLAFFDATYDVDRDGTLNDELTHVAIVVGLEAPDTVVMIHWGSREVKELRMTPSQPELEQQDGRVLNQPLRSPAAAKQYGQRLSAQLFHGYAKPPCPRGVAVNP